MFHRNFLRKWVKKELKCDLLYRLVILQGNKPNKSQNPESSTNNKKVQKYQMWNTLTFQWQNSGVWQRSLQQKDLSDEDVHLLARILSVGLVDADPNYLHHLKGYRDLHGGWATQRKPSLFETFMDTTWLFLDIWMHLRWHQIKAL